MTPASPPPPPVDPPADPSAGVPPRSSRRPRAAQARPEPESGSTDDHGQAAARARARARAAEERVRERPGVQARPVTPAGATEPAAAPPTDREAAGQSSARRPARPAAGPNAGTRPRPAGARPSGSSRSANTTPAPPAKVPATVGGGRPGADGDRQPHGAGAAGRGVVGTTPSSGRRLIGSSGRSASAGRIIGVGFLCFALWFLLDAKQLYNAAQTGSDGTRRSVAMDITHPVADLANALRLSGLVDWGDTVLNRNGSPGSSQPLPTPVTQVTPTCTGTELSNGVCYLPHGLHGHVLPGQPVRDTLPPIPQPTPANPLTVVDIGDSIGEDLGFGVGDLFQGDKSVHVVQEGEEDTGLVQQGYYNWPGHLQLYLNKYSPGAVIIMMGANDDQNLNVNGQVYTPLSTGWVKAYTARVDELMEECAAAGAHVIWVGLPPMGGGNITNVFVKQVNAIYAAQARLHEGVTFVSSWNLFAGPKGQFEVYKKINGSEVPVRSTDGIHLDPAGWDLLAQFLVKPMQAAWGINLHVGG